MDHQISHRVFSGSQYHTLPVQSLRQSCFLAPVDLLAQMVEVLEEGEFLAQVTVYYSSTTTNESNVIHTTASAINIATKWSRTINKRKECPTP